MNDDPVTVERRHLYTQPRVLDTSDELLHTNEIVSKFQVHEGIVLLAE